MYRTGVRTSGQLLARYQISRYCQVGANCSFWKIGLTLLVIVGTVTFLVTGKLLQKHKPELLPEVLAWIPCWKKPEKKQPQEEHPPEEIQPQEEHPPEEIQPAEPDPPIERPNPLEEKRDQLRAKIRDYRPGSTGNVENDLLHLEQVNINLFGLMSAGKSSFVNSLFCAFAGTYDQKAAEGTPISGGSTSKQRAHYKLTNFINLLDNRGMRSFKVEEVMGVKSEILAERSVDTYQLIQKDLAKECHCAVFVYHHW
ncbi:uncharacterized protein [Diadema antillarum]|uniref:uncharacterized protein n=1 Tax=Diadema antillarum TaxID=105358 RepID=UPI003A85A438